jgi:hypothetical protein
VWLRPWKPGSLCGYCCYQRLFYICDPLFEDPLRHDVYDSWTTSCTGTYSLELSEGSTYAKVQTCIYDGSDCSATCMGTVDLFPFSSPYTRLVNAGEAIPFQFGTEEDLGDGQDFFDIKPITPP